MVPDGLGGGLWGGGVEHMAEKGMKQQEFWGPVPVQLI
jgi:hypothetical protein